MMNKTRGSQFQPSCLLCQRKFRLKDGVGHKLASANPVLLNCGHCVCNSCVYSASRVQKAISCPSCTEVTAIKNPEDLQRSSYLLGLLYEGRHINSVSCDYNVRMVSANAAGRSNGLVNAMAQCLNCYTSANCVCFDCGDRPMCSKCFTIYHNQSGLTRHKCRSIISKAPPVQKMCEIHESKVLEYYCVDDNERICSDCYILGAHKLHSATRYVDQMKECIGDVGEKVKAMQKTNRCLKHSEQYLLSTMNESKDADDKCIEQIRQHFLFLHGILQRRESYLVSQVRSKADRRNNLITQMLNKLQDRRGQTCNLLSDVKSNLLKGSNRTRSDSEAIYESLLEFSDEECYVDSSTLTLEMFFSKFDLCRSDLAVVQEYGTVSLEPEVMDFKLLSSRDVDDGLLDDISDDEEEDVPELELLSARSSNASIHSFVSTKSHGNGVSAGISVEPSVPSASRIRKPKQKKRRQMAPTAPTLVTGRGPNPRSWTTMKQELVRVSHICSPGEFYIHRKCDEAMLNKQEATIRECCNRKSCNKVLRCPDPKDVHKGELYLVRYNTTKSWYRARVVDIIEEEGDDVKDGMRKTLYDIVYIDYGNTEYVPISKISIIPPQLAGVVPFAVRCSLFCIDPIDKESGWSQESIQMFTKFVNDKFINMTVIEVDDDVLLVDLGEGASSLDPTNSTPVSVRDALVFLEFGCFFHSAEASSKGSVSYPPPVLVPACCKFYKPTLPSVNSTVEVLVSYSDSPTSFYVQRVEDFVRMKAMMDEMHAVYSKLKWDVGLCNPIEGLACVAKYNDGKWYRARVMGSPGCRRIKVFYVDFGDTDELPHTQVKAIYPAFLRLPEMAFHCSLVDVLPLDGGHHWSRETIEYFRSFVDEKLLKLNIVGHVEQSLLVTARASQDSEEVCFNVVLVYKEFAISSGPCSLTECVRIQCREEMERPFGSSSSSNRELRQNMDEMLSETAARKSTTDVNPPRNPEGHALYNIKVHVSRVESPRVIYVQFVHQDVTLKKLIEDIQYAYEKSAYVVKNWQVEDMCVVYSLEDKLWHRAIVGEIVSSKEIKVFLVDWGHTFIVTPDRLRAISEMFRTLPSLAYRCHLVEILAPGGSDKWPSVATEFLSDIVSKHEILYLTKLDESELQVSTDVESFPVDLFYEEVTVKGALDPMTTNYWSLTELLLEHGLALPTKKRRMPRARSSSTDIEASSGGYFNFEPAADKSDDSSISIVFSPPNTLEEVQSALSCPTEAAIFPMEKWAPPKILKCAGQRFEAMPTNVTNDGHICMHDTLNASALLSTIKSALKSKYENSLPCARDLYWAPGQACVAQFAMDNGWYRAEVISVSSKENKIKVLFIDYGNEENVQPDQLRKDICLLQYPQQGYYCQLFNVAPVSDDGKWPVSTLNLMHKTIVDKKCYVTIVVPGTADHPPKVIIEISEGNCLNDLLVDLDLARMLDEEPPEPSSPQEYDLGYLDAALPDVGSNVPVVITAVVTPTSFYSQRTCVDEEEEAMRTDCHSTMNTLAADWPLVTEPKIGGLCCAKFTEDDVWFRAIITDVNETEESSTVVYVDYGNKETVGFDRMRQIPKELLLMPKQAFLCELFQVCPVDTWTTELENKLLDLLNSTNSKQLLIEVMESSGTVVQVNLNVFVEGREHHPLAYQHLVDDNLLKLVRKKTWEEMA